MIKWNLNELCNATGLKTSAIEKETGFKAETIRRHRRMKQMPKKLDRKYLEGYCALLKCKPGDILK